MAKYSNPEIAAAYERGVQAGIIKGPALEPSGYANLLSTLGQNIAGMAKEAQKATTAEVTAILDGISKVEASAQAGVDAKAMDMWQNYQDNLTKLQTAAAQVDTVVLRKASEEATNISRTSDVTNPEWRREYLKSIVTQLQDGSGRPFLYGTMQAAMSTLGYVDQNTGAITPGKMAEAVTLIDSLEDPHLKSLAKSLFQNYTSQGTYYSGVQEELQRLNEMLGAVEASGLSPEDWYKNNRAQWEKFVHAHDQFRAKTLPYLTDKNGAFYADLKATIAPEMSEALAYQQGFYEGLTGTGGSTTSKDDLQYKLARYISSPAAQRTAADWGFNIGRIVPVKDEATKAEILRQFPTGVYFEDLGGIYVPGPDDRTMAKWSAKREGRSDPRGTLLEQAFGRHYRKETEYVDLTLKGPASSAGTKGATRDESYMHPFEEGWVFTNNKGQSFHMFIGKDAEGKDVAVQFRDSDRERSFLTIEDARKVLKTWKAVPMKKELLTPENMDKAGFPPHVRVALPTPSPETSDAQGETLRNVQVVPARTGDPIGSINIIDPVTGEIRNIAAEEVEDIVTVGGGGERQDLQTFVKRVRALRSQARGIEAANKSAATAAEHPESAAYSSTRATDAAESVARDNPPDTRANTEWKGPVEGYVPPTPLEPVKAEPVPDISAPQAEVMKAAAQSGPTTPGPRRFQFGDATYYWYPPGARAPGNSRYYVQDKAGFRAATETDMMAFSEGQNAGVVKETTVQVPVPAPASPVEALPENANPPPVAVPALPASPTAMPPSMLTPPPKPASSGQVFSPGREMEGSKPDTRGEEKAKEELGTEETDADKKPRIPPNEPEQSGKAEPKPTDKRTASLKAFVSGYNRAPSSATVPPAGGNPGYPNAVKQVADTRYS